jgi:hypothetical protein
LHSPLSTSARRGLPPGAYTLKIVTRYSNGSQLLKRPHTIIYEQSLIVADSVIRPPESTPTTT